ncbi:MAG: type I restriction-modification system subunit M [Treponema sp.]|jgi:type I restriction enzyme M protein|nr:type I restriction-modification system subunit M [Treponema sp.]
MNKQQLAAKIWESANQMRSKIEANDYKDYILGFIFYKYLSEREIQYAKEQDCTDDDIKAFSEDVTDTVDFISSGIGYFISYENLFSTWLSLGSDFSVANVRDALSAFSRLINKKYKKVFEGVFDTLQTGLSKLGDSAASQTKAIRSLITLIKDIPMDGSQDYDVLGFIYEYLISMFAANAGKKAGEFYTPHEVSLLMSEIVADHLKDRKEIEIYDPTSGSGSLLITIGKSVAKHISNKDSIKYYAQEIKQNTYNLTRMNLVMRGINSANIITRNGDTLEDDWPYFDEEKAYAPLYVDAVVSNPPYSQKWDPENKDTDPRYARFGLAPKTKADYAFLLHDLYHLKPDGIMTIVLPHGVLFRGGEEGEIRKHLIEENHIDAIIGLPANIFFGTGIPTIIMVLKQKKEQSDVLIIDASKGFIKEGKNNKLRSSDIKRIADTVQSRKTIDGFSRSVSKEEIRKNDYNLNIPRYVDSSEPAESWDIYASMFGGIPEKELDAFAPYWTAFPHLRSSLFTSATATTAKLTAQDCKQAVLNHPDVTSFLHTFTTSFDDFDQILKHDLLTTLTAVDRTTEETVLSTEIFSRLASIPLVDPYEAYQILDDNWGTIAADLEVLQTEGLDAVKKVDPHMVTKKKDGKETDVQDGWVGHVLPFTLVQQTLMKDELDAVQKKEDRLSEITSQYDEILESLSEDEKESECINDTKDAFVAAVVTKEAKQLQSECKKNESYPEDSYEAKIIQVNDLLTEEKALKTAIKDAAAALEAKTKTVIEQLNESQIHQLLEAKWITPLMDSLQKLPETLLSDFASRIQSLSEKYAETFADVESQIHDTETSLASFIDELTGSDADMQGLAELKKLLTGAL